MTAKRGSRGGSMRHLLIVGVAFAGLAAAGACGGAGADAEGADSGGPPAGDDVRVDAGHAGDAADAVAAACQPAEWVVRLPGAEEFFGVGVAPTADCGLLVVADAFPGPGGRTDVAFVRLDREGRVVFERFFGGEGEDHAAGIVALPGGGFAVAGSTGSGVGAADDGFLLRLDAAGEVQGEALLFGGDGVDQFHAIAPASDGGLLLAGASNSESLQDFDVWVLRLDSALAVQWERRLVRPRWQKAAAVAATADGGAAVAGFVEEEGTSNYVRWVGRLEPSGHLAWQREYRYGRALAVSVLTDGDIVFAGQALDLAGCDRAPWVARFGPDGEERWERELGTTFGGGMALLPADARDDIRLVTFAYTGCAEPITFLPLSGPTLAGWVGAAGDGAVRVEHLFAPDGDRWETAVAAVDLPGGGLALVGSRVVPGTRASSLVVRRLVAPPTDGAEAGASAALHDPCPNPRR